MRRLAQGVTVLAALACLPGIVGAETATEKRLRVLEETVQKQMDEIKRLRSEVEQEKASTQATQKQTEQAQEKVAAVEAAQKTWTASIPDWLKKVTLFGDLRFRFEGFYNQPHTDGQVVTARNRERVRARVGLTVAPSDEVSFTTRLASGNSNNPISTNQDLTAEFTPWTVNLDWAYLTLTPGKTFGIRPGVATLVAGKFGDPIFRPSDSELLFDSDLSPEGFYETFALLAKPLGASDAALDQVKIHVLQWLFQEVSNSQDGWMIGGQVNPQLHIGTLQFEAGLGQFYWLNPDLIAQSLGSNSQLFNSNAVTTMTTTSSGKSVTTITGYRSAFNTTDLSLQGTVPNLVWGQPLALWVDGVYNWQAENNGFGWQGGVKLGQTKVRGDWSLRAGWQHLEREAVISSFTWSDFGVGGTNAEGPLVSLSYQLLNPLTLSANATFTNFIENPRLSSQGTKSYVNNPTLTRLQLEGSVKF